MKIADVKKKFNEAGGHCDTIGKNKSGNIVFRRGFFYTHGYDSKQFEKYISENLKKANIDFTIVNSGEHYASFRGGQSVAQGSHWYVEIELNA